jgi:hypothetical protein
MRNEYAFEDNTLGAWQVVEDGDAVDVARAGRVVRTWTDGNSLELRVYAEPDLLYLYAFLGVLDILVDPHRQRVLLGAGSRDLPRYTVEHLLFDQVAPRLLSNSTRLVLHAAALEKLGGTIGLSGISGRGKSTLALSLAQQGWRVQGDDAMVIERESGHLVAYSPYNRLRAFSDSLEALQPAGTVTPLCHYSRKERLLVPLDSGPANPRPLLALFVLDPASEGDDISVMPIPGGVAAMTLVEHSFCIDPEDLSAAGERLALAAHVASTVPVFALQYPRRYDVLPAVGTAIEKMLTLNPNQASQLKQ